MKTQIDNPKYPNWQITGDRITFRYNYLTNEWDLNDPKALILSGHKIYWAKHLTRQELCLMLRP